MSTANESQNTVGERLKEERRRLKLTQAECAKATAVSLKSQSNYEADEHAPNTDYLQSFHTLGGDIQYIVIGVRSNKVQQTIPLDSQRLSSIFEQIDIWSETHSLTLSREKQSHLIGHFYKLYLFDSEIDTQAINDHLNILGQLNLTDAA